MPRGIRMHERTMIVNQARTDLEGFLIDWEKKYELTYAEVFSILGDRIANIAKYAIRAERHPDDPEKRGDEA